MTIKQVIIVRKDLKLNRGKMSAQVAHASLAVITNKLNAIDEGEFSLFCDPDMSEWLSGSFAKICLYCDSEAELLALSKAAEEAGLNCSLIKDNGATTFHGVPTYTTCAVGPNQAEDIDKITGQLKLVN